jgi:hypothetical protein
MPNGAKKEGRGTAIAVSLSPGATFRSAAGALYFYGYIAL